MGGGKMNCEECKEYLLDYIRGMAPPSIAKAIKDHLNVCPTCADEVDQVKTHLRIMEAFPAKEVTEKVVERVCLESDKHPKRPQMWEMVTLKHLPTPGRVAAAILLLVLIGLWINPFGTNPIPLSLVEAPALGNLETVLKQSRSLAQLRQSTKYSPVQVAPSTLGPEGRSEVNTLDRFKRLLAAITIPNNQEAAISSAAIIVNVSPGLALAPRQPGEAPLLTTLSVSKDIDGNLMAELNRNQLLLSQTLFQDDHLALLYVPALRDTSLGYDLQSARFAESAPVGPQPFILISLSESAKPITVAGIEATTTPDGALAPAFPEDEQALRDAPAGTIFLNARNEIQGLIVAEPSGSKKLLTTDQVQSFLKKATSSIEPASLVQRPSPLPREILSQGRERPLATTEGQSHLLEARVRIQESGTFEIAIDADKDGRPDLVLHSDHPGLLNTSPQ